MPRLDPRLVAVLNRMAPRARALALQKLAGRQAPSPRPASQRTLPLQRLGLQQPPAKRPSATRALRAFMTGPGGKLRTDFGGPLVTRDAGDAVAAGIASVFDKEARGVLADVPGGAAVLNAVEGAVGDLLRPGFSGGVSPAEAAYIAAGATPVEKAARAASVEGVTGSKEIFDPSSPTGYRTVGGPGGRIRGVPAGFEPEALED